MACSFAPEGSEAPWASVDSPVVERVIDVRSIHQTTLGRVLAGCVLLGGSLHAQTPPAKTNSTAVQEAMGRLGERIGSALAKRSDGLDPLEKRTVGVLAIYAALIVETGECADPSAAGSAAETFLFTFAGLGRKSLQPIFDLPASRKTDLLDKAMAVASQVTPDAGLAESLCHGALLPALSAKPIAERLQGARQVLSLGLSPPTSNASPQPPTR